MISVVSRLLRRFALAFLCAGALALPAQAAPESPPALPEKPALKKLLPKKAPLDTADRKKILQELYDRLRKAENTESAELVASAIEKLWLRSGSDTVDLLMDRSAEMLGEKQYDVALELLDSIVEIAPDYPEGWTRRAAIHFAKKEFGKSIDDLRHALALDPSHYKAIQGLGLLMQEIGDKQSALRAFREVLKVHPHLDEVRQAEQELSREIDGQGI